jgi:hypothetical protein
MQCDYDQDLSDLTEYITEEEVKYFKTNYTNLVEIFETKNQNINGSLNSKKRSLQLNDEIIKDFGVKKSCVKSDETENFDIQFLFSKNECIVID